MSFALGAAIPLLILALAGRRVAERIAAFRTHQRGIRAAGGALMIALALALAFNLTDAIQRALPGYTESLQATVAANETVREQLDLGGLVTDENRQLAQCSNSSAELEDCGPAPAIRGIDTWLNTPDGAPVDLADLRGKVVLLDFWAYSCINCQRSVPHVTAWEEAYRDDGLVGHRRAHPRVRVRARDPQRRRRRAAAGHHVPGGAGQLVRHVDRVPEPVLARALPDRRRRPDPPGVAGRGRLREAPSR